MSSTTATVNGTATTSSSSSSVTNTNPSSTPPTTSAPIEVLAEAALKGDLLFDNTGNTNGEDLFSAYSKALATVGGTIVEEKKRPLVNPDTDFIPLLLRPETATLMHSILYTLIEDKKTVVGTYAETRKLNMKRVPFVNKELVHALLIDFERRSSFLASKLIGWIPSTHTPATTTTAVTGGSPSTATETVTSTSSPSLTVPTTTSTATATSTSTATTSTSTGGSTDTTSTATLRKMCISLGRTAYLIYIIHYYYSTGLLGPAIRLFSFERYIRMLILTIKSVCTVIPEISVHPHLCLLLLWQISHSNIVYSWNESTEGVSSFIVMDEWTKVHATLCTELIPAMQSILLSETNTILKHSWWASVLVGLCDMESTADTLANTPGMLTLMLRESTDNSQKNLSSLLMAFTNGVRFATFAKQAVELNAPKLLMPLVYHDSSTIAYRACETICHLANRTDLLGIIENTGVLNDIVNVLRSHVAFLTDNIVFAEPDVAAAISLARKDNPLALRLCGILKLRVYAGTNDSEKKKLLERSGLIDIAREMARDTDAFLYITGVRILSFMEVPIPFFRDPERSTGNDNGTNASVTVKLPNDPTTVLDWSIDEVCDWVGKQPFRAFRTQFRESLVDGTMLATMTDEELESMGIKTILHRKAIRSAIGKLLYRGGLAYPNALLPMNGSNSGSTNNNGNGLVSPNDKLNTSMEGGGDSMLLSSPTAHTIGSPVPMLRTLSGTNINISQPMIGRTAHPSGGSNGSNVYRTTDLLNEDPTEYSIDVFISYRRKTGAVLAQLLNMHFKAEGMRTFLDVENLGQGAFDIALKQQLTAARNVVVVLSESALDRCMNDYENKDFVRKEIAMSLKMEKNIIPVTTEDFKFPDADVLPEDIRGICSVNAVPWSHMYQDASMKKLLSFMKR